MCPRSHSWLRARMWDSGRSYPSPAFPRALGRSLDLLHQSLWVQPGSSIRQVFLGLSAQEREGWVWLIPRVRTRLGFAQGHRGDGAELRLDPRLPASLEPGGAVLSQEQLADLRPLFRKHLALLQQPVAGAEGVTQSQEPGTCMHGLGSAMCGLALHVSSVPQASRAPAPLPPVGLPVQAQRPPRGAPHHAGHRSSLGEAGDRAPALISASLLLSLSASSLCDLPRWPGPPKLLHPLPHTSHVQHPHMSLSEGLARGPVSHGHKH